MRTAILLGFIALALVLPATAAAQGNVADLTVSVTAPADTTANADVAFTVTLTNLGADSADTPGFTTEVPAGTTFVSMAADPAFLCTSPAIGGTGTVSCSRADLASGAAPTFTLTVHVPAGTAGGTFITDVATATSTSQDPNSENDSGTATVQVGPVTRADMSIAMNGPSGAAAGTNIGYTITVTNGGPDAAGFTLTDEVPQDTTFVSLASPAGATCTTPAVGATGTVSCSVGSLAASATAVFTLVVKVAGSVPTGDFVSNTAQVSTGAVDPTTENDGAARSTLIGSADMTIAATGPSAAVPGDTLTYTLTLGNAGPDAAPGATLSDTLPAGTTFVSFVQDSGPAFALTTPAAGSPGTVSATLASLAKDGAAAFTLKLLVDPATPSTVTITNTATAGSNLFDADAANSSASVATTVSVPVATTTPTATPSPVAVVAQPTATPSPTPTPIKPVILRTVVCKSVPKLKGKTFTAAKKLLKKKKCKVTLRRKGALKKRGRATRVKTQSVKAGKKLYKGDKLTVRLG